jgi:hypothetical protein
MSDNYYDEDDAFLEECRQSDEDFEYEQNRCPNCGCQMEMGRCQDCDTTNTMRNLTIFDIISRFISGGF